MNDNPRPFLDDGEAKLSIDHDTEFFDKNIVIITMSNGGGFASLYCTIKDLQDFMYETKKFLAGIK